jgi:hypothetical protein
MFALTLALLLLKAPQLRSLRRLPHRLFLSLRWGYHILVRPVLILLLSSLLLHKSPLFVLPGALLLLIRPTLLFSSPPLLCLLHRTAPSLFLRHSMLLHLFLTPLLLLSLPSQQLLAGLLLLRMKLLCHLLQVLLQSPCQHQTEDTSIDCTKESKKGRNGGRAL